MEAAVVLFLMLGIVVGVAAIVIGVPLAFGLMAWDVWEARKTEPKKVPARAEEAGASIAVKRGVARAFVILGSAFWSVATFAEMYSLRANGVGQAALGAFIPAAACLATLVIGWYWERLTAAVLLLASFAVVAWGIVYQFEPQVWAIMTIALIGPMLTASVLFWIARREQEAFERATLLRPQMAFVFAARSSLTN